MRSRCVGNDFAQNPDKGARLTHFNRLPCFRLSPVVQKNFAFLLSFYLIHIYIFF